MKVRKEKFYFCNNLDCYVRNHYSEKESRRFNFQCLNCMSPLQEKLVPFEHSWFCEAVEKNAIYILVVHSFFYTVLLASLGIVGWDWSLEGFGKLLCFVALAFIVNFLGYQRFLVRGDYAEDPPLFENNKRPAIILGVIIIFNYLGPPIFYVLDS